MCSSDVRYYIILLIVGTTPTCEPISPVSSVAENEEVNFMCNMTYRWRSVNAQFNVFSDVKVSFGWDSKTSKTKAIPRSQPTGAEEDSLSVTAQGPEIPPQNCTIKFTFTPPYSSPLYTFADNHVFYTCRTDPIPVRRKLCQYLISCLVISYIRVAPKSIPLNHCINFSRTIEL